MLTVKYLFQKACEDLDSKNYSSAFKNFLRASEFDDEDSQNNLAILYENGLGTEQNYSKAIYWYKTSFENGSLVALNNLANLYKKVENFDEMINCYEKSVELGDGDSMLELAEIYYHGKVVEKNIVKAKKLFEKAVQSSDITPEARDKAKHYLE